MKIEKRGREKQELENKWKEVESNYIDKTKKSFGPEIQKYWKERTNEPYKNILKDEDYSKDFKNKDDLVVHRVTTKEKDKERAENDMKNMEGNREKHNGELKVIYSTSQKSEHKKKFEYNHVYKYRVQHDQKTHTDLKEDKIQYYKEQQKKEEEKKQIKDSIMDYLVTDGIFSQDELNSINATQNTKSDNTSKKEAYLNRKQTGNK
jgi:hypothetical protein